MESTNISSTPLTLNETAALINALAQEYSTTVPAILYKLDSVSGDLKALNSLLSGDKRVEWSKEEDDLLAKNPELLKRWKGSSAADQRKKYLHHKVK